MCIRDRSTGASNGDTLRAESCGMDGPQRWQGSLDQDTECVTVTQGIVGLHQRFGRVGTSTRAEPGTVRLSLEEAYELATEHGALEVLTHGGVVSAEECWGLFGGLRPGFPHSYAAHRHFKTAGFAPKGGDQYGADLVLYQPSGAGHSHSKYLVVVLSVGSGAVRHHQREFSWTQLHGCNRLAVQVKKELVLCYVCLLYTSPSPRDRTRSRMPSSA
eukprot:TRINITY_DN21883_c0_g2_i1.p1 TRINITY_DN21883_c0_g2~~TRINITY_DN21883_c0_g2_i1.p1  ORF type:complete len:216 (-),score=56.07 TRINITY_DN21883_c0_g2_i1:31-678(-)